MSTENSQLFHLRSAFVGGLVAALIVLALPAVAAQVGDALSLGEANRINARTNLRGRSVANLTIINDAQANATALDLRVRPGNPPLKVNSSIKVAGLNADLLDGFTLDDLAVASDVAALESRIAELERLLAGVTRDASLNLALPGNLSVAGGLALNGDVAAGGVGTYGKGVDVGGNLSVVGGIAVGGTGSFEGDVSLGRTVAVGGDGSFGGDVSLGGDLSVVGGIAVGGTGSFEGDVSLGRTVAVGGDGSFGGDVSFGRGIAVSGDMAAGGSVFKGCRLVCVPL